MTYEELKKAYEESQKRCSELEKEIAEKDKVIENKVLRIEHLTELVLKRNKMLFGQKSEKGRGRPTQQGVLSIYLLQCQLKPET